MICSEWREVGSLTTTKYLHNYTKSISNFHTITNSLTLLSKYEISVYYFLSLDRTTDISHSDTVSFNS